MNNVWLWLCVLLLTAVFLKPANSSILVADPDPPINYLGHASSEPHICGRRVTPEPAILLLLGGGLFWAQHLWQKKNQQS